MSHFGLHPVHFSLEKWKQGSLLIFQVELSFRIYQKSFLITRNSSFVLETVAAIATLNACFHVVYTLVNKIIDCTFL